MNRSRQIFCLLFSMAIAGLCFPSWAENHGFENVEIKTIRVAEGVYMLLGQGGNIGVSAVEDGVFLIDDQFAPLTPKIQSAVSEISDQPIRFLINTHWHFDHTGGNENLGNEGVVIVAHDQVRERLKTDQVIEAFQKTIPASPKAALPVITFNDTTTFHLNGQTIHAFHVAPAHTDGDVIIHFREANVFHMGDTYFNGFYPFIDYSSGGSIDGMISAVEQVLALVDENTQIIPGHGPLSNRAELEAYRAMLVAVKTRIKHAIDQNVSLEQLLGCDAMADLDKQWGNGFLKPEQFKTIVYKGLLSRQEK